MKPKDFRVPYSFDERCVYIHDRVWHIPVHYEGYEAFTFPGWASPELFGNDNPVNVEYCSGNGTWVTAKAQEDPGINWVAVEKRYDRVRKIWSKIKNSHIGNLIVVWGEAETATQHYFPSDSVSQIYINFPDPWPKRRHQKHRLMQTPFVTDMLRTMKADALLTLVTDDKEYSEQSIAALLAVPGFAPAFPLPHYVDELPGYGTSFFDTLWRDHGRQIRYHQFLKTARASGRLQ